MAARIITIAQRKGGSGKTTLAANLAVAWASAGRRVVALDTDPQRSLAIWYGLRGGADGASPEVRPVPGWRAGQEADRLARGADLILLDSPPHDETEARIAIRAADLVLVPVQPSPMDLWATERTLELVAAEARRALLVPNRVPPRSRLAVTMLDRLAGLGAAVATSRVGNRVVFASALADGRTAAEVQPGGPAALEIGALAEEILETLR